MDPVKTTAMEVVSTIVDHDTGAGEVVTVEEHAVETPNANGSAAALGEPAMAEPSFPTEETGMSTAVAAMLPASAHEGAQEPGTVTVSQTVTETVTAITELVTPADPSAPGEGQDEEEPTPTITTVTATTVATTTIAAAAATVVPNDKKPAEVQLGVPAETDSPTEKTSPEVPATTVEAPADSTEGTHAARSPGTPKEESPDTPEEGSSEQPEGYAETTPAEEEGENNGGGNWVAGLMSAVGFGDGNAPDKSVAVSAEEEELTAKTEPTMEAAPPATEPLTDAGFPTEEGGDNGGKGVAREGEETGDRGIVSLVLPSEGDKGEVGKSTVEERFPTEEEGVGVGDAAAEASTRSAAADGDKEADASGELSSDVFEKRKETIAAEIKAFLDDSEDEGFGEGEGVVKAGTTLLEAGDVAAAAEPVAVEVVPATKVADKSPEDTEFSAKHAKRVIGAGVVLQRKASISSTAPELKNKSDFSSEDAVAKIAKGAISERTRLLKEEQEALKAKHATERQDTDLPAISRDIKRKGSVKGKAQMYHQAIEDVKGERAPRPAPPARRLSKDWTSRREHLEEFVVKYDPPPMPAGINASATGERDGPTRYIPLPNRSGTANTIKRRSSSSSSVGPADAATTRDEPKDPGDGEGEVAVNGTTNGTINETDDGKILAASTEDASEVEQVTDAEPATNGDPNAPPGEEGQERETGEGKKLASPHQSISVGVSANGGETEKSIATVQERSKIKEDPASSISNADTPAPAVSSGGGCCVIS